jgi:hypothetical protein
MSVPPSMAGELTLGHILDSAGVDDLSEVLVIRHVYDAQAVTGITGPSDVTGDKVLAYTRSQDIHTPRIRFPKEPPRLWLVFMKEAQNRARFFAAYENHGEVETEQAGELRYFDLRESPSLAALRNRLVLAWTSGPRNWNLRGTTAAGMPVLEIADPEVVPFPGFDGFVIGYAELQQIFEDPRYKQWVTALRSVQGIYVIADTSTGKLYVGKADGAERIYGRWGAYARDGHGGNIELKRLMRTEPTYCRNFTYSILRVFGPEATLAEVNAAESHYKHAVLSRAPHGYNLG